MRCLILYHCLAMESIPPCPPSMQARCRQPHEQDPQPAVMQRQQQQQPGSCGCEGGEWSEGGDDSRAAIDQGIAAQRAVADDAAEDDDDDAAAAAADPLQAFCPQGTGSDFLRHILAIHKGKLEVGSSCCLLPWAAIVEVGARGRQVRPWALDVESGWVARTQQALGARTEASCCALEFTTPLPPLPTLAAGCCGMDFRGG